jgi:hypothetical protein
MSLGTAHFTCRLILAASFARPGLIHSRIAIHTVTVAGHQADFTHNDPLSNITIGAPNEAPDCHRHPELKRKIYSALQEGDEGELGITIPREVPLKQSGHLSSDPVFSEREWPVRIAFYFCLTLWFRCHPRTPHARFPTISNNPGVCPNYNTYCLQSSKSCRWV